MNYTFLFPGQGSQKVGMGQDFFKAFDIAKQRFNEANDTLGRDLASICFDGPEDVLTATQNTQPALFTVESIICDTLREKSIIPSITAGHSLGEYGALYAAGFISFTDGIRITAKRGELMARAGKVAPGAMAAVMGMPLRQIQDVLSDAGKGHCRMRKPEQPRPDRHFRRGRRGKRCLRKTQDCRRETSDTVAGKRGVSFSADAGSGR
jgi:[acyl-carrier-protein] S-malonyltransferase